MKNKVQLSLISVTLFLSASNYANVAMQRPMMDLKGWVVGGNIGYGYLSTTEPDLLPPAFGEEITQSQSHNIGYVIGGAYVGYDFPVFEHLLMGLEMGYKYLGQSKYRISFDDSVSDVHLRTNVKVDQQAVDFLLTGKLAVSTHINFIAKAGAAYVRSKTNQNSTFNIVGLAEGSLSTGPVIWRIRPEVSLGASYAINNQVGVNLMYTYVGGADANVTGLYRFYNSGPDKIPAVFQYNALTLGISYSFC